MEDKFKEATDPKELPRLVFTCDWQKTLNEFGWHHCELLEFLSDAKRAGHRVIITSSSRMAFIPDFLDILIDLARDRGFDILDRPEFELISKQDLKKMNLVADYSFDNKSIATQRNADYSHPKVEIRVHPDFSTSPHTLDHLRSLCGFSGRNVKNASDPSGVKPECIPK